MYITHEIKDMKNMNNWSAFPLIKDIDDAFVYMTHIWCWYQKYSILKGNWFDYCKHGDTTWVYFSNGKGGFFWATMEM
jgi:hypothetical protein